MVGKCNVSVLKMFNLILHVSWKVKSVVFSLFYSFLLLVAVGEQIIFLLIFLWTRMAYKDWSNKSRVIFIRMQPVPPLLTFKSQSTHKSQNRERSRQYCMDICLLQYRDLCCKNIAYLNKKNSIYNLQLCK